MSHDSNTYYYVYDGECPLCTDFAKAIRLRDNLKNLELIDARNSNSPILEEIKKRKLNLDKGAVFILNNIYYFGKDAPLMVSLHSTNSGFINKLNKILFANSFSAFIFYPIIREIRNLLLFIRSKPKLNNLND